MTTDPGAADAILTEALAEAYPGGNAPEGIQELLKAPDRPGKVCATFFWGRSGTYLSQSFFHNRHPQVLTVHPAAFTGDHIAAALGRGWLERFNAGAAPRGPALDRWCEGLLGEFPLLSRTLPERPEFDTFTVSRALLTRFLALQMNAVEPGGLGFETLFKMIFLAYRLAAGGPIAAREPLVCYWQAHTPSARVKQWTLEAFRDPLLLTLVRFPEKTLDSHLAHHAYETVSPPLATLFHRLCFDHMARNSAPLRQGDPREAALRFEDLHGRTRQALEALCRWFQVPYFPELAQSDFTLGVNGVAVNGVRDLAPADFRTKLLGPADRRSVRALFQEEYRAWGYEALFPQLQEASPDPGPPEPPGRFPAQRTLCALDDPPAPTSPDLELAFRLERVRRDRGLPVLPLLLPPGSSPNGAGVPM